MDTNSPLNARIGNHEAAGIRKALLASQTPFNARSAAGQAPVGEDWHADGIVDRMLAYRDWWNLPVRRPHTAGKLR
jgi:hypothetical protein